MSSGIHYERRVAFSDTDAMGVVHHANYLRYCEEARVAWMRLRDLGAANYPRADRVLAVTHFRVWHYRPARFDDLLRIDLQVRREGVKIRFQYSLYIGDVCIAQAETLHVTVDSALRPMRIEKTMLQQLEAEAWTETWLSNS